MLALELEVCMFLLKLVQNFHDNVFFQAKPHSLVALYPEPRYNAARRTTRQTILGRNTL